MFQKEHMVNRSYKFTLGNAVKLINPTLAHSLQTIGQGFSRKSGFGKRPEFGKRFRLTVRFQRFGIFPGAERVIYMFKGIVLKQFER